MFKYQQQSQHDYSSSLPNSPTFFPSACHSEAGACSNINNSNFCPVSLMRRSEQLTVIEEDENDSSCLFHKGQLRKQTAVQCLASLVTVNSEEAGHTTFGAKESLGEIPPCEEDDWGYFYADSSTGENHPVSLASGHPHAHWNMKHRRLPRCRRRPFKYPRAGGSRCASTAAVLPPKQGFCNP